MSRPPRSRARPARRAIHRGEARTRPRRELTLHFDQKIIHNAYRYLGELTMLYIQAFCVYIYLVHEARSPAERQADATPRDATTPPHRL